MQQDFDNIVRWAHDNGIIININKTKCMHISSPYNKDKTKTIRIKGHDYACLHSKNNICYCSNLEVVLSNKYLGLTIDNNINWNIQVNTVCNKLRTILGKLHNLKFTVTRKIMYLLYYALADAVIVYGIGAYGLTFKSYIDKIKCLQIKLLKLLVDNKTRYSLNKEYDKLFKICKVLPVELKIKMNIIKEQFDNNQYKRKKLNTYPTRSAKASKLLVPKVKNYYGRRERRWLTPSYLNELPRDLLVNVDSKNHLKSLLKKHYLSLCP